MDLKAVRAREIPMGNFYLAATSTDKIDVAAASTQDRRRRRS